MLDHFTARFGTFAASLSAFGTFGHVWKLLTFGRACVARLSAGFADGHSERPPAGRQSCRNPADFGAVIAQLHAGGMLLVSAGNQMRTMPVTLFAFGHARGTLRRAV